MQVIVAFVVLEVRGEFGVVWDVTDLAPDPTTCPPSNIPEFRDCEPEGIKIVRHL
jgi:hypothetical protein